MVRKVISRGLLATRAARIIALAVVICAFAGYCALSVAVLKEMFGGSEFVEPILISASLSTLFWLAVAYTIIRVLFLKADELLELSYSLPVTNKERTLAFALFEACIILLTLCTAFGGLGVASLIIAGPGAAGTLMTGIVMPAITLYLLVSVGYLLLERVLLATGLSRLRGIVVPAILGVGLAVAFRIVSEQSEAFLASYMAERQYWAPQLGYLRLAEIAGPIAATAAFLAFCGALVCAAFAAAPRRYVAMKRHFRVLPARLASSRFGAHVLVIVRSFETSVAVVLSSLITVLLFINGFDGPPYAILLVTFQGVYAYANSEPLRRTAAVGSRPLTEYACLIGGQVTLLALVAVPASALTASVGVSPGATLSVFGLGVANICVTTLAGIAFPPERGNPFSVVVGLVLTVLVIGIIMLAINLFGFPPAITVVSVLLLSMVTAAYSIYGISRVDHKRRFINGLAS